MDFNELTEKYKKELMKYYKGQPLTAQAISQQKAEESNVQHKVAEEDTISPQEERNINETPKILLPTGTGENEKKDDFSTYTEIGYIRVKVFAANQAIPLKNAKVTISKYENGQPAIFVETKTDEDGNTPVISVPTPPREFSQHPEGPILPYGIYNIVVKINNFKPLPIYNVPVFAGVISVQPVAVNYSISDIDESSDYNL